MGFVKFAWQSSQFVIITIAMGISVSKSKVKIVLFHFQNKISIDNLEKCDKTKRREVVHKLSRISRTEEEKEEEEERQDTLLLVQELRIKI